MLNAKQLAGEIAWWKFEGITFKLAKRTTYTPDFVVQLANGELVVYECKGFMRDDAAVKLKVAAAMFPIRFFLVRKIKRDFVITEIETPDGGSSDGSD